MSFEPVYSVIDYYDGPRTGFADYGGRPHYYKCNWDDVAHNYADRFTLYPVDDETLQLDLERNEIFRKWQVAYHSGAASIDSHPDGNDARFDELSRMLEERQTQAPPRPNSVSAKFRAIAEDQSLPKGMMRRLVVEWHDLA